MSTATELLEELKSWDPKTQEKVLERLDQITSGDIKAWFCTRGRECDGKAHEGFDYPHARGDQWPPPGNDWLTWLLKGGRGSGKTRSGAEWTRKKCQRSRRFAVIGPTIAHVREVMVEGESGLINVFARFGQKVLWEPSKRRITLPTGGIISTYSGEEPDRLRGPEHESAWLDEPSHIPLIQDVWDNLLMGLRIGKHPQILCTTTPLPTPWTKELIAADDTITVTAPTYANLHNLTPTFRKKVLDKYEGTRLGRQELYGEILEDVEGAIWSFPMIEDHRELRSDFSHEEMDKIVVAIDPAGTSRKNRDETGIVVVGRAGRNFYVLHDASGNYTPKAWGKRAIDLYEEFEASDIVAEKNYGGDMVRETITNVQDDTISVMVVSSRRGKYVRAEPIVSLYEQGRVHHVGQIPGLEDQMLTWVPDRGDSPDRVDALVHGLTYLSRPQGATAIAVPTGPLRQVPSRVGGFPSVFSRT